MPKFIVMHGYKTSPEAYAQAFTDEATAQFVQANAMGQFAAQCLMTWDPLKHGRRDRMICLWEAEKPEQILEVMQQIGLDQHLTSEIMQVEQTDWLNLAQETH